uniref:Uncharacterized protein n=1 Tax=Nicotiana tabacum TaxID=4097 RepID=A0A1S4DM18_TOBAC|nr:PREDICTED: uncharacterized protein LOC107831233 [Nicotiana tabacum]
MTPEYKTNMSMLKYFDMACIIALGTSVKVQYVKHNLKKMVHDLQNWDDEMIVPNQDQDDSNETEGTTLRDPQYTNSRGRPRLNRYRGRIEYYFTSSQPRGVFGASNGARAGVRGDGRGGGRVGVNRGGRGGGRSGGRRGRGNGQGRGTSVDYDGSLGVNEQIDATQSQSSLFDLNAEPDMEI